MPRVNGDCVIRGFQHQDAGDSISLWCPPTYPAVSHRPASNPFHVVVAFLILSLHIIWMSAIVGSKSWHLIITHGLIT